MLKSRLGIAVRIDVRRLSPAAGTGGSGGRRGGPAGAAFRPGVTRIASQGELACICFVEPCPGDLVSKIYHFPVKNAVAQVPDSLETRAPPVGPGPAPDLVFSALHAAVLTICAVRLLTVVVLDGDRRQTRRAYSSQPVDYPVGGCRPVGDNHWAQRVFTKAAPFVADPIAAQAPAFPDRDKLAAIGCHAAMSIPVLDDGERVYGVVNLLGPAGQFGRPNAPVLGDLVALRRAALIAAMRQANKP